MSIRNLLNGGRKSNDPSINNDRITKYLSRRNEGIFFAELSPKYLDKTGAAALLASVPVPIGSDEESPEPDTVIIALNMGRVVGGDPSFPYRTQYLAFIEMVYGENADRAMIAEGAKYGGKEDYEAACMFFRAALILNSKSKDALYLYGRSCLDAYNKGSEDEAYIGLFKAESIDCFELLTMIHEDYEMGYYFLGYGYVNLGLYLKAKLTWDRFMELTDGTSNVELQELREEIGGRINRLDVPIKIENATNEILRGNYSYGRDELIKYTSGKYSEWWPLWYYLAIAEESLGHASEAIEDYKTALKYTPSNIEIMKNLAAVLQAAGRGDEAEKYRKKIMVVEENLKSEQITDM